MPRLYLTNDSYPELRDVAPQWARTVAWWRAILRAFGDRRFWAFLAAQAGCLAALVASAVAVEEALGVGSSIRPFLQGGVALAWLCAFAYLQVSWGGDIMRSHLRAVSQVARYACPGCGHSLVGHLEHGAGATAPIRCPECAAMVARDLFAPPYRVPRRFRAFPPWGGKEPGSVFRRREPGGPGFAAKTEPGSLSSPFPSDRRTLPPASP